MQELQPQTVPEEFFNLTQLAEVTLIAGKLSTTDINEIRNYISKSESCHDINNSNEMDNIRVLSHYNEKTGCSYESTKKKWKNNWENFKDQETLYENLNYSSRRNNSQSLSENSPSSVSPKTYAFLSSSCSSVSSDDDSTKSLLSYSHKVFDRKKQRSFKQSSTESEYEFHFECQRPPYAIQAIKQDISCDIEALKSSSSSSHPTTDDDFGEIKNEKYTNDGHSNENHDSGTDARNDDHMCPECGKKYSTSMSAHFSFLMFVACVLITCVFS